MTERAGWSCGFRTEPPKGRRFLWMRTAARVEPPRDPVRRNRFALVPGGDGARLRALVDRRARNDRIAGQERRLLGRHVSVAAALFLPLVAVLRNAAEISGRRKRRRDSGQRSSSISMRRRRSPKGRRRLFCSFVSSRIEWVLSPLLIFLNGIRFATEKKRKRRRRSSMLSCVWVCLVFLLLACATAGGRRRNC
jgi:hypothetical protein